MINVIIKELQLYLLKQQKDINLEVILNHNGIIQEQEKQINQHLYFLLIIEKNILQEIIMILLDAFQAKDRDLDAVTQKYI